jgi:hypothetical protein
MFIGHFALGFAAKRATPRVSLPVLFATAQLADLLWPVLVAAGIEQVRIDPGNTAFTPLDFISYPFSHSLLMLVIWGVLCGIFYKSPILFTLVVSHWVLDFVTHRPDMPLYPGGPKFGLGLWNSVPATLFVEVLMYAIGVWIYTRTTIPRDNVGRWAFASLVAFLLLGFVASIFGGAPPSVPALYLTAIVLSAVVLLWSWWADNHRKPVSTI